MNRSLTIRPVEYNLPVTTLTRIGEVILNVFDPVFDRLHVQTAGQMAIDCPLNAEVLLLEISHSNEHIVGIVASDLVSPQHKFAFEFAYYGKPGVVVSTYRLDPESYGLPADTGLLSRRIAVESIHGLGHNFRLVHHKPTETKKGYLCPMSRMDTNNWYDYVLQIIDKRDLRLCNSCYSYIARN